MKTLIFLLESLVFSAFAETREISGTFCNPVLPGFNPDPSICRVGDDYYLVTSSFVCYPGLPVYHSKDLVNWELVNYAVDRPDMMDFEGVDDNNGIWDPTLRYHDGLFYLIATANKCGGNFYMTASDPCGRWSDPVWLKDIPGIDPSLFWDKDGRCYYVGNRFDGKKNWPAQCTIWGQEIDLEAGRLIGEPSVLTHGHANNARYAEGLHIYLQNDGYLLLMAEGGSGRNHAVTAHHSKKVLGRYVADEVNPVLTSRHKGHAYPLQNLGHADLVQTQNGDWWAVFLGNRHIDGGCPLGRETFLCPVSFEGGTPIFNPAGREDLSCLVRPDLPWSPVAEEDPRDDFDEERLGLKWHCVRVPSQPFYDLQNGKLVLSLLPQVIDSLTHAAMLVQRVRHHGYRVSTKLDFSALRGNEAAGVVLYRTANGYYALLKTSAGIQLVGKNEGVKKIFAEIPYRCDTVCFSVDVDGMKAVFRYGKSEATLSRIGNPVSLDGIVDNRFNKFNGLVVGIYATSQGEDSDTRAEFEYFEYNGSVF